MRIRGRTTAPPSDLDPGTGLTARTVALPDGRRLRAVLAGDGDGPLVVLEAGMSAPAATWIHTQREVAAHTRTLSYDRAGYGGSDVDPQDRTLERITDDLAQLLDALDEQDPVVLVGHSWGGPIIRLFADRHPERVAGIVFVDATVAEYLSTRTARTLVLAFGAQAAMARCAGRMFARLVVPTRISPEISEADMAILTRDFASSTAMLAGRREATQIVPAVPVLRRLQATGTPDVPTVAMVGGRVDRGTKSVRALLNRVTTELMAATPSGRTVVVDGVGHLIPQERPAVVRDTILEVLDAARATGRPPGTNRWRRRLETVAREFGIVGASLAFRVGDRTVEAATGVLNTRTGAPATPDSLFQIGSISKVYTTTVALRLVDDGRLDLDAPVTDVLPDLVLADPEAVRRLTLRHLLTHTSGIEGDVFTDTGRGDDCVRRFVDGLSGCGQIHPPDATWSYSNTGFVIVGRMIEKVTGLVWDEAMREFLFRPLGLRATVTLPEEALRHATAHGHVPGADGTPTLAPRWEIPRSSGPAGGIVASAREVLAFAGLHLRGGIGPDGTRLLSADLSGRMREEQVDLPDGAAPADSWGLGWFRQDWPDRTVVGHDGATIGQSAFLLISPDDDLTVCLLTNGGPARDLFDALVPEIVEDLTGARMPRHEEPPDHPPVVEASAYTGVYERVGVRLDVTEGTDTPLSVRVTHTGAFADLAPSPPEPFGLVAAAPGRFLTRLPGERRWNPVVFYEAADGNRYAHFGARAAPRTGD